LICDLLTITIGDVVHVLIHCRPISKRLSCLQPSPAVRRRKPPSPGFWAASSWVHPGGTGLGAR
jgi:hypothetical protein